MLDPETDPNTKWLKDAVAEYETRLIRYAAHLTGDIEKAGDVVQGGRPRFGNYRRIPFCHRGADTSHRKAGQAESFLRVSGVRVSVSEL